jgi:small subunit ribosomal protein S1
LKLRILDDLLLCARQIKDLNEPIEVKISEWNTGGLLTRIEVCVPFVF